MFGMQGSRLSVGRRRTRLGASCGVAYACVAAALLSGSLSPARAATPDSTPTHAQAQCLQMARTDFSRTLDAPTQVAVAAVVEATARTVAYCQVQGYVQPQVGFELQLPLTSWNGKFIEVGCGGWCGSVETIGCEAPVRRGYACIAADMGHKGTPLDVLWAENNLQALVDFGYRGVHVAALAGKAIAARFYEKPLERSYFMGCSTGGYQGVTSAQRFPRDFDGIVAGAPDIDGAAASLRVAWSLRTLLDEAGKPRLTPEDLRIAHDVVLARCDMDDGVKDGIVGNPFACRVQTRDLACGSGRAGACLSASKADTVMRLYAGPTSSKGERISTGGLLPGSELAWTQLWPVSALEQFYRYGIPGYTTGPAWSHRELDFDREPARTGLAAYYDNTNPDLRSFKRGGAKLIVYHGGTDTIDLPGAMTDYYETVERTMGGRAATQEFFRLFVVPGMNHCGGGKGASAVDWLSVLEAWVEKGQSARRGDECPRP